MTKQQIDARCRNEEERLLEHYFGNLPHEAAVDRPETIEGYHKELPIEIERQYFNFLQQLWAEVAPGSPRTVDHMLDNPHIRELVVADDREMLEQAHADATHISLFERITHTNHKDVTYYKGLLKVYTQELLTAMRCDFMEDVEKEIM